MVQPLFVISLFTFLFSCNGNNKTEILNIADNLEFVGIAVEERGYHIWGSSPIIGTEGKTHLFVARWPKEFKVDPGWRSHSEIAHYIADHPEGPFVFSEVIIKGNEKNTWDKFGAHNPCIKKVGVFYILLYIANDNPNQPPHPKNQRIGMLVSKSLSGPWEKAGQNGMILQLSNDPNHWSFNSGNGVANPAFLSMSDNRYYLYFKSWGRIGKNDKPKAVMGVAIAEDLTGPITLPICQLQIMKKRLKMDMRLNIMGNIIFLPRIIMVYL